MGYTHYWRQKQDICKKDWTDLTKAVRVLLKNLPKVTSTAGGYFSDCPLNVAFESDQENRRVVVSTQKIRFNGTGTASGESLGHETFYFTRKLRPLSQWEKEDPSGVFNSCKTGRKPYDLLVCGVLLLAKAIQPDNIKVSSDGDLSEWLPAINWVTDLATAGKFEPELAARIVRSRLREEEFLFADT